MNMKQTTLEPVVEAEVLAALDFDTSPVEVTPEPEPVVMGGSSVIYTMPIGSVLTFTVDNITWSVPKEQPVDDIPALTWEMLTKTACPCGACQRHTGPMNPTAKALWVEALRDPARKQGRGALRQGDRWCALGVLIDVAMQAGVALYQSVDKATGTYAYDGNQGALPRAVMEWAGLTGDPRVNGHPVSWLNDSGLPFSRIADQIEVGL